MRKLALVLATAVTLAVTAVATPSPAHARYYGHGGAAIFGGLVAGAMIAGIASSAYGYGRGMATMVAIIRHIPHTMVDTIPRILMGGTTPDITAVMRGGPITGTGGFTRPDTSTTTAAPAITAIALGVAGSRATSESLPPTR